MKKRFTIGFVISKIIMLCVLIPMAYFGSKLIIDYAYILVEFDEFNVNIIDYEEISRTPTWSESTEYVITVDVDISYEVNGEDIFRTISMKILETDYNEGNFIVYGYVNKNDSTFRRYVAFNEGLLALVVVCLGSALIFIAFLFLVISVVGVYQRIKWLRVGTKVNDLDRIDANESNIYKDYDDDIFEKYMKRK